MRTTVIPAQITTVEDKIAGNLSVLQIVILMIPVFFGTVLFTLFPPTMKVVLYKIPPVLGILFLCLILSLRVKGKVVAQWLIILLSYNIRPRFYVCNKNDQYLRDVAYIPKHEELEASIAQTKDEVIIPAETFSVKELKQIEFFMKNPNYSMRLKPGKKGNLFVSISEVR